MGGIIDDFSLFNLRQREHILDVLNMTTAAFIYQNQTEHHKSREADPGKNRDAVIQSETLDDEDP